MYFPILRGRQNELLALRELLSKNALSHIIPIIEPVKTSTTLLTTLEQLNKAQQPYVVIINPMEGTFLSEISQDSKYESKYREIVSAEQAIHGFYPGTNLDLAKEQTSQIAYFLNKDTLGAYQSMTKSRLPDYTILPADSGRLKRSTIGNTVALEDEFKPQERNVDYRDHLEDFLTEEHLHSINEGHVGFSDYSIVGPRYSTKGFMPQVVALHLPYFKLESIDDQQNGEQIWIRHFTSEDFDENGRRFSDRDVAGKFGSALKNMIDWVDRSNDDRLDTTGLSEYRNLLQNERYPGLGVAKKLSIMHHIEMINSFLQESESK